MPEIDQLRVKLFCDGADFGSLITWSADPRIKGFTTNPTLMRKAQVVDYEAFARELLKVIPDRPVSFEVLADDPETMEEQALTISAWGPNVNVKMPVTNTWGAFTGPALRRLSRCRVALNVTALFTLAQIERVADCLDPDTPTIISVFAGRIADTGINPAPLMRDAVRMLEPLRNVELLWASPREVLNIFQAEDIGCHIITLLPEMLGKLSLIGKNLDTFSQETVRMFYRDACAAGYQIDIRKEATILAV
ncbi:transaldolase [Alloacidobacterium dinghuense]|uniref:Transaldolase n=1 Tax=Alloacidobacterium dinghuense TaxID=2763107 RepID=A0A7G8BJH1_9BACT|nr:transaldolase [Alloacidobacterium dinghuense]QNI32691.1 transaldolase [Alloacidobacterium dinghuense]